MEVKTPPKKRGRPKKVLHDKAENIVAPVETEGLKQEEVKTAEKATVEEKLNQVKDENDVEQQKDEDSKEDKQSMGEKDVEENKGQPPKKRGRPKKGQSKSSTTKSNSKPAAVTPSPVKRNGRKKSINVQYAEASSDEEEVRKDDEEEYSPNKKNTKSTPIPKKKRGRGRPPGSKNTSRKAVSAAVNYDWDDSLSESLESESSGEEYRSYRSVKAKRRGKGDSDEDFKCYPVKKR